MLPISVCIIAKNEEAYIEECLKRLARYDWEIIVTDTGSTDRTVHIAAKYAHHVYSFPWCDDFSAARNFGVKKASNSWILSIDCDEYLTTDVEKEQLFARLNACMRFPEKAGMIRLRNPHAASVNTSASMERVARFFHRDYYHFEGKVHEQLARGGVARTGVTQAAAPAVDLVDASAAGSTADDMDASAAVPVYFDAHLSFYHIGYQEEESLKRKAERNIRLLEKELERLCPKASEDFPGIPPAAPAEASPDVSCMASSDALSEVFPVAPSQAPSKVSDTVSLQAPYLYYQLGQSYFVLRNVEKACEAFDRGLSYDVDPRLQYVRTMVESYGYCLLHLKRYEEALLFENIYDEFSSHADFVFLMGLIYMNNARFDQAVAEFEKAATIADCSVEGINSYCAFYNIGVIYECSGQVAQARRYYEKCGEYELAKEALGRLAR